MNPAIKQAALANLRAFLGTIIIIIGFGTILSSFADPAPDGFTLVANAVDTLSGIVLLILAAIIMRH